MSCVKVLNESGLVLILFEPASESLKIEPI